MPHDQSYDEALARAASIYPGLDVGRPGRSRLYRPTKAALHLSRLRYAIDVDGIDHVDPDRAAIIVGNHLSALDPVVGVVRSPWRVAAFTKVEAYESGLGFFFRLMGQIPLRRGDEDSTDWALDMARRALADGSKVAIYPEGTRGPDRGAMYRLHQRLLVPLLTENPGVAVHAIATTYPSGGRFRARARVRVSPRLPVDAATMSGPEMTAVLRDALVELSGLRYIDRYAIVDKRRAEDAAAGLAHEATDPPAEG
jgi:1-acyl-sn-glycerol-3-phosphate acyltransferase